MVSAEGNRSHIPPSVFGVTQPSRISVDSFLERYAISQIEVRDTLQTYPTLCYLLGRVTDEPQGMDSRPDGISRPVYFLTEGSGMFGLKNRDDVMRWRGIVNHVMGTARQVYHLTSLLQHLPPEQQNQFGNFGYDIASFSELQPTLFRDFMFISHAGRRATDETVWHNVHDAIHEDTHPGIATFSHLTALQADPEFLDLMRVEMHSNELTEIHNGSPIFPRISDNILTYCDWTYGQEPNTLTERFSGLREHKRQSPEVLDVFEHCGNSFESALHHVISPDVREHMAATQPYSWEMQIREAYCASAGVSLQTVFPAVSGGKQ